MKIGVVFDGERSACCCEASMPPPLYSSRALISPCRYEPPNSTRQRDHQPQSSDNFDHQGESTKRRCPFAFASPCHRDDRPRRTPHRGAPPTVLHRKLVPRIRLLQRQTNFFLYVRRRRVIHRHAPSYPHGRGAKDPALSVFDREADAVRDRSRAPRRGAPGRGSRSRRGISPSACQFRRASHNSPR